MKNLNWNEFDIFSNSSRTKSIIPTGMLLVDKYSCKVNENIEQTSSLSFGENFWKLNNKHLVKKFSSICTTLSMIVPNDDSVLMHGTQVKELNPCSNDEIYLERTLKKSRNLPLHEQQYKHPKRDRRKPRVSQQSLQILSSGRSKFSIESYKRKKRSIEIMLKKE